MITSQTKIERELELDTALLQIHHSRGLYQGFTVEKYQQLKCKESEIARDNTSIQYINIQDVIDDIIRTGATETQFLSRVFILSTEKDTRDAYVFGHQGLVVYFARGVCTYQKKWDLGLISAHIPGGSGGGGWGLNGTRKLQFSLKTDREKRFDPGKWIADSFAWAGEGYGGSLKYGFKGSPVREDIMRMVVDKVRG